MIEPYEEYPYNREMLYFLGQSFHKQLEKEDARKKIEAAIIALKKIGNVALRRKVQQLEEHLIEAIKKEKDIPVILEKKAQVSRHYKDSLARIENAIDKYVEAHNKKAKRQEVERKAILKNDLKHRIERAQAMIEKAQKKGMDKLAEHLQARITKLKMELETI